MRPPAALLLLALAACGRLSGPPEPAPRPALAPAPVLAAYPRLAPSRGLPTAESTPSGEELAFAASILGDLQAASYAGNREHCGYLGLDAQGTFVATPAVAGTEASCPLPRVPAGMTLVASFHTHGTYSPLYASEWPTTQDVLTDASDGIDGYIATPGGRLWHVDSDTMTVREICGRGCLPQDPSYRPEDDGPVRPVMTYAELLAWERG